MVNDEWWMMNERWRNDEYLSYDPRSRFIVWWITERWKMKDNDDNLLKDEWWKMKDERWKMNDERLWMSLDH
jgi:hypothetical protein